MSSPGQRVDPRHVRGGLLAGLFAVLGFVAIYYGLSLVGIEYGLGGRVLLLNAVLVGVATAIVSTLLAAKE